MTSKFGEKEHKKKPRKDMIPPTMATRRQPNRLQKAATMGPGDANIYYQPMPLLRKTLHKIIHVYYYYRDLIQGLRKSVSSDPIRAESEFYPRRSLRCSNSSNQVLPIDKFIIYSLTNV